MQITVSDTGPGLQEGAVTRHSSTGVGLANIRDRLVQAFGEEQRFEIKANEEGGFCVEIDIPLQFEEAKEAA